MPRTSKTWVPVELVGQGEDEGETVDLPRESEARRRRREQRASRSMFWKWGCVFLILAALGVAIAALIYAMTDDAHWVINDAGDTITSRQDGADVEIREGADFIVHNKIIDSGEYTVYERIELTPAFGTAGPDLLYGASDAAYARLQAQTGVGVRVTDRTFLPIGGPFASNGLFGEDGLAHLEGQFATWKHGPIIGTGPAILVISDESLKENIQPINAATSLAGIIAMKPSTYDWKGAAGLNANTSALSAAMQHKMLGQVGFIAQELADAEPSAVHSTADYLPEGANVDELSLIDFNVIVTNLVASTQQLWGNALVNLVWPPSADTPPPSATPFLQCLTNTTAYATPHAQGTCICAVVNPQVGVRMLAAISSYCG